MQLKWLALLTLLSTITLAHAAGSDPDTEIATATQTPLARNPNAKYFSFPLINDTNFSYSKQDHTQDILSFKPIVSRQISENYDLILRVIAPIWQHQANINGWGDLNPTVFISPFQYHSWLWGAGPTLFIPTATNKAFGSGKWSIGPEFALFNLSKPWVIGILTNNAWSFAGDPKRTPYDQFSLQYFVSYNMPKGWFLTSQPTITANWKAPGNQVWTVPVGLGVGKSTHLCDGGVTLSVQSFYNVIRPSQLGPNWTLQAKLEFTVEDRRAVIPAKAGI